MPSRLAPLAPLALLALMAFPRTATADKAADATAFDTLARSAFQSGKFSECAAYFAKSHALVPEPKKLFNQGLCHQNAGELAEALAAFQEYLKIAPKGGKAGEARTRAELLELKLKAEAPTPAPTPAPKPTPTPPPEPKVEPTPQPPQNTIRLGPPPEPRATFKLDTAPMPLTDEEIKAIRAAARERSSAKDSRRVATASKRPPKGSEMGEGVTKQGLPNPRRSNPAFNPGGRMSLALGPANSDFDVDNFDGYFVSTTYAIDVTGWGNPANRHDTLRLRFGVQLDVADIETRTSVETPSGFDVETKDEFVFVFAPSFRVFQYLGPAGFWLGVASGVRNSDDVFEVITNGGVDFVVGGGLSLGLAAQQYWIDGLATVGLQLTYHLAI